MSLRAKPFHTNQTISWKRAIGTCHYSTVLKLIKMVLFAVHFAVTIEGEINLGIAK